MINVAQVLRRPGNDQPAEAIKTHSDFPIEIIFKIVTELR